MNTCISAVQHLRPLRGGAQSHLLRASDGNCYVTKFRNNPQHIRVLANEMLTTRLGLALGLPMPRVEVIEVSDWLIEHTEELRIKLGGANICLRNCLQESAMLLTSLEFLSWTSGHATATDGKRSSATRRHEAGGTPRRSLIRDTAAMRASGPSLTIP